MTWRSCNKRWSDGWRHPGNRLATQRPFIVFFRFKSFLRGLLTLRRWGVTSRFQELDNAWHTDTLSRDEEQCLADSFNEFLEVTLKKVRQHRVLFPPLHRPSISKLDYLLRYVSNVFLIPERKRSKVRSIFFQFEDGSFLKKKLWNIWKIMQIVKLENRKIYSIEIFLCNELCFESISWLIFKMEEFCNLQNEKFEWRMSSRTHRNLFLFSCYFFSY